MTTTVRAAAADDYDAVAEIHNLIHPDDRFSADELRYFDEIVTPPQRFLRLVALDGDELIASAYYTQYPGEFHPRHFHVDVQVRPGRRRCGVATLLYRALLERLEPWRPTRLRARVREGDGALAAVLALGYRQLGREWRARLDVAAADLTPYRDVEEPLAALGVRIVPYAALPAGAERDRAFYQLYSELRLDTPRSAPATPLSFADFRRWNLDNPDFLPEGALFALCGDEWIGMSQLWRGSPGSELHVGLTAVKRSWRRRGIALALKVRSLRLARDAGYATVYTSNATDNRGMIAINDRLGFARETAWIELALDLEDPA